MKKIYLSVLCFLFVVCISLTAQDLPKNTLTVKSVWINYVAPNNDNKGIFSDLDHAIEIGYNRHINNWLSIGLPLRLGAANFPIYDEATSSVNSYTRSLYYGGLDITGNVHFLRSKMVSPFAYVGIGGVMENFKDFYAQAPLGLGIDLRLNDYINLIAQSDYRIAFKKGYDNWQHAIGVRVALSFIKDMDKDGVPDKEDMCIDVPGLASLAGCPDQDLDGIADKDDKCPSVAGVVENMGCPSDRDKDGVYDVDDMCPDTFGKLKGCPDGDNDGVADKDDKCPIVPGPVSNKGCPEDRDNDGFIDSKDSCPDEPGKINGCPDSDNDGVINKDDKCPETPGLMKNFGCPEIKVEDKKVLNIAMHAISFTVGTAILTKESYKNLDDVVMVLNKYPEMNISIEGHADSTGEDEMNLKLSERRAKACLDYLLKKGIAAARCTSAGFGETKPIGDNATAEGRKMNRRTEFNPIWR